MFNLNPKINADPNPKSNTGPNPKPHPNHESPQHVVCCSAPLAASRINWPEGQQPSATGRDLWDSVEQQDALLQPASCMSTLFLRGHPDRTPPERLRVRSYNRRRGLVMVAGRCEHLHNKSRSALPQVVRRQGRRVAAAPGPGGHHRRPVVAGGPGGRGARSSRAEVTFKLICFHGLEQSKYRNFEYFNRLVHHSFSEPSCLSKITSRSTPSRCFQACCAS